MSEARVWDRLAGRYDTIVRIFDTSYPLVRERLVRDLPPGGRTLEIAAGTGQFTPALARLAEQVLATDVSSRMVEVLGELITAKALEGVEARVMSAYAIDGPEGAFDAVFCANALHVMDTPSRALAEFHRVLRKDGLLIAPTFLHGVDGPRRMLSRALSVVSPFVANTRFDLDALVALIGSAGFEIERSERMAGVFPLGYVVARRQG